MINYLEQWVNFYQTEFPTRSVPPMPKSSNDLNIIIYTDSQNVTLTKTLNNEFEILGGRDLKFDSEYYWEGRDKTGDWSYLPTYAINITQCFNSYFQLLTGSVYETDENCKFPFIFYNEKLWKSMITLQPFIFLGQPNTISMLKRFGFKTFHPLINEDYDKELNNEKRKVLIYDEIKRLCSMSIDEIDKWFWIMYIY